MEIICTLLQKYICTSLRTDSHVSTITTFSLMTIVQVNTGQPVPLSFLPVCQDVCHVIVAGNNYHYVYMYNYCSNAR